MTQHPQHARRRLARLGLLRLGTITLCAAGMVLGSATLAAGYFSLTDTGAGGSRAGAVGGPTGFTATSSLPNQATLSWTAPADPSPTGYTLTQSPGTVAGTCKTNLTAASVSCTATGLTSGTPYEWTLRADDHSWQSPATTATVTTVAPTISLSPTSGTGGTLAAVTGSGFAASSALTFAFTSSGGTTTTLTPGDCTPTTTATGALPAGPCEVTIPTSGAAGGGTVEVTDGAGNQATAPFDVTGTSGIGSMTVTPPSALASSTGNTFAFTFTAPSSGMTHGTVTLAIPAGWTAPSTTGAAAGTVTLTPAAAGTATVTGGRTITVTGVTLAPGTGFAIIYGTGGGAHGVTVISTPGPSTFLTKEASTAGETPAPIAVQPKVVVTATCSPITETHTLASGTTAHFLLRGAGGGDGGNTGGAGAGGAVISGTLANTSGAKVTLTYTLGCNGSPGGVPAGGAGGPGYAGGGDGGTGYSAQAGGGGGGGASALTITVGSTTTEVAVAGGGGGGAGEQTGGGAGGGPASPTKATAPTTTPATGGKGTSPSSGSSNGGTGGGGGGGGVHLAATGGGAGAGGTGGTSYVRAAGTFTGVTFANLSITTGTSGSTATVRFT